MSSEINKKDSFLVAACLAGDEGAFKELLDRYLKSIFSFIYYLVRDSSQAEDLAQETFVKVWKNLRRYDPEKSFKTWIFAIAKNTALDWLKKKKTTPFSFFGDEEGNNKLEEIAEDTILPDEILVKKDLVREMERVLALIPENYRIILTLRYKEDFSLGEIAEILNKPYNTIKAYHGRALVKMKEVFLEK